MITRKLLVTVARQEIKCWNLPPGLALAILFSFVHRVTTGETVEETFFKPEKPVWNYEI